MLAAVTVDVGQVVRAVDPQWIGVNATWWDTALNTSQNQQLVQAAGLNLFRILPGGATTDGFHFNAPPFFQGEGTIPSMASFVASVNGQAVVPLDYGSGSPQEAAALLAYLNAPVGATTPIGDGPEWNDALGEWQTVNWQNAGYWASLRAATPVAGDADGLNFMRLGRTAPFGFHYFEVGNEEYGTWEIDHHTVQHDPATYVAFAKQFQTFAAAIDPSISIGIDAGAPDNSFNNWIPDVLQQSVTQGFTIGFISDHNYVQSPGSESDSTLLLDTVSDPSSPYDWAKRETGYTDLLDQYLGAGAANVELLATEFNSVYSNPGKQSTSLVNGLFIADSLGAMMETSYDGAAVWDLRNGVYDTSQNDSSSLYGWREGGDYGLLGSPPDDPPATGTYVPYPSYFAEQLASNIIQAGGTVVQASSSDPNLAVYAVHESNGDLDLLVINKSPSGPITGQFGLNGFQPAAQAQVLQYGEAQDTAQSESTTGQSALDSFTAALTLSGSSFSYAFPAYSMSVLELSQAETGPTITSPAAAAPSPVTGTTTALSVSAADPVMGASLTYTWSTISSSPAGVVFSVNGTSAAGDTTATFSQAGTYTFQVIATDPSGLSATSDVTVNVDQTPTSIKVSPLTVKVGAGTTQPFTAQAGDQFGNPMSPQPGFTWSLAGGTGSVNSATGVYSAPEAAGSAVVEASSGGIHGKASVTVAPPPSSYTVNDPGDAPLDKTIGPGETAAGTITLRSAIEQVNIDGGGSITFAGSMNISVNSQLDTITAPGVTIDGGSPGSVVISGASGYNGVVIKGGGATIQNIQVVGFLVGITLQSGQNTIQDISASGNVTAGIEDMSGSNTILENVVSENLGAGIILNGASKDRVYANILGEDVLVGGSHGNGGDGLEIENGAANNTIGGLTTAGGNACVDNGANGIELSGAGTAGNLLIGNDTQANALAGMMIEDSASDNTIGGTVTGAGNTIDTIVVGSSKTDNCEGDAILENSIGADIDLGDDGVILNDSSGHSGPNLFQNFPVLTSALTIGGVLHITGSLTAARDTAYRVELFVNPFAAPSYGPGEQFLTFSNVKTNAAGVASFAVEVANPLASFVTEASITATATDPAGNTSELSLGIPNQVITYAVNDPGDAPLDPSVGPGKTSSGTITLRSAIEQANIDYFNTRSAGETIGFISALDISVSSQLDTITAAGLTIEGGTAGGPVVISGGPGYDGLVIGSSGNTIENLQIDGFNNGIDDTGGSNVIADNLVFDNNGDGIKIQGSSHDQILGNTVTSNVVDGVFLSNASGNVIGAPGDGNVISGNGPVVSGIGYGVDLENSVDNLVQANLIGTDATGESPFGNGTAGIELGSGAFSNTIGGTSSGAGNVISGNSGDGIRIAMSTFLENPEPGNVIQGNMIGVDRTGTKALGNAVFGIELSQSSPANTIGGVSPAAGNVISGNGASGIAIGTVQITIGVMSSSSPGNIIENNFIGTDITGKSAIGNAKSGVVLFGSNASDTTVGAPNAGNLISGNKLGGVSGDLISSVVIQDNFIGTDVTGTSRLGNGGDGVFFGGSSDNTIGGTSSGDANIIAFNTGNGITIGASAPDKSTGDAIRENSIFANSRLGIDLGDNGVTLNDSSGHSGPNLFQDFPVLSSAITSNGITAISGTLSGAALTPYVLEFFSDPSADPSGHGQGETFLVATVVFPDSSGQASFAGDIPTVAPGQFISATATDPAGDTSEFSADAVVTTQLLPPLIPKSIAAVAPNPRNTPVSTVDVTFNEPVNLTTFTTSALTLTDNGGPNLISGAVTISPVSGSTYQIAGLTGLTMNNGNYKLTVSASSIQDQNGQLGSGSVSTTWLMDTTPPTSRVNSLPKRGNSLIFAVSVTGSDPGSTPSGVASYDIYLSTNGGPWKIWTTVPASNPSANFTALSNTTYAFYSIAHDNAGNTEVKQPAIEASTFLSDLTPPVTSVNGTTATNPSTVAASTGTFTLNVSGTDAGGSGLAYFEVFVSVDAQTPVEINAAIPAGVADKSGDYRATILYQGLTDGVAHQYHFYSIGIDGAGNVQATPSTSNLSLSETFAQPTALQVTGLTVEHGAAERSYIRYLDVAFNESDSQSGADLTKVVNSIGTSSPDIKLYKYDLAGDASSKMAVPLQSSTAFIVLDHAIEIDFGAGGLGGNSNTTAADGYYELDILLPSGQTAVHHFDRLLGDVTGDGLVDSNDLNAIAASIGQSSPTGFAPLSADANGNASVTAFDLTLATRSKGRKLASTLSLG